MKKIIWIPILIVIIIVAGAWIYTLQKTKQQKENEVIKIGVALPLTGKVADYGNIAEKSIRLAMDELDEEKGKFEIIFEDHRCDSSQAASIAQKFIHVDRVKLGLVAVCSGAAVSMTPIFDQARIPLIVTVATSQNLSGISPFVFRVWPPDSSQVKLVSKYLQSIGADRIGIFQEKTDFTQSFLTGLMAAMPNAEFTVENILNSNISFYTQINKIDRAEVQAIVINTQTAPLTEVLFKEMVVLGTFLNKKIILSAPVLDYNEILNKYKDYLEGAVGTGFVIDEDPAVEVFKNKFKEKYKEEVSRLDVAAMAYDSFNLAIDYLGKLAAGVLEKPTYQGISGKIIFDENNDLMGAASLLEIKDGFAVVKK